MTTLLRHLFFLAFVRPTILLILGMNVRHRERLPRKGPAVIVANHNSHLDTLALMSVFPQRMLGRLRPVAAADYFLSNRLVSWFATRIIGIIPIARAGRGAKENPLKGCEDALSRGEILILFPEGSRGEPERLADFKTGAAHLARRHPEIPFVPVFLHGLGKALPKGETLLIPFFCDVFIGDAINWQDDRTDFMSRIDLAMRTLADEGEFPEWS